MYPKTSGSHTYRSHTSSRSFFGPVQPKLTIGAPNDRYEREADQVADHVMKMEASSSAITPTVQKECAACEQEDMAQPKPQIQRMGDQEEETMQMKPTVEGEEDMIQTKPLMKQTTQGGGVGTPALRSKLSASKGGGSPLPSDTNTLMSQSIGSDFSHVRIHTGNEAIEMNQGLNARAFTNGSDVFFNQGEYAPASHEGKRLLAHELTHVVQQQGISPNHLQRGPKPSIQKGATVKYVEKLQSANAIAGTKDGIKHAKQAIKYWKEGYARIVFSPKVKALIIEELLNQKTIPSTHQQAIADLVMGMGDEEMLVVFKHVSEKKIKKGLTDKKLHTDINSHKKKAKSTGPEAELFNPEAIMTLRDAFINNAYLPDGKKKKCLPILEVQLKKVYQGDPGEHKLKQALKDSTKPSGRLAAYTLPNLMGQLVKQGLAAAPIVIDYKRKKDPERIKQPDKMDGKSAFGEVKKAAGTNFGWHLFGMSIKDGYHATTLFAENRPNNFFLYLADQNWSSLTNLMVRQGGGSKAGFKQYDSKHFDTYLETATNTFWKDAYDNKARAVKADPEKFKLPKKPSKADIFSKADTKTLTQIWKLKRLGKKAPFSLGSLSASSASSGTTTKSAKVVWVPYKIQSGDRLYKLAKAHNTSPAEIVKHSPSLKSVEQTLKIGQEIMLPKKADD